MLHLLEVFFANHDPTTPNRQGPDQGSQYRSVIFYYTPEQKKEAAETFIARSWTSAKQFTAPDRDAGGGRAGVLSRGGVSPEVS